jgi:hypothetical protein
MVNLARSLFPSTGVHKVTGMPWVTRSGRLGDRTRFLGRVKRSAFRAVERAGRVTVVTRSGARTEASGLKVPPVSHAGVLGWAVLTAIEPPTSLPETVAPMRYPWARFQARCRRSGPRAVR